MTAVWPGAGTFWATRTWIERLTKVNDFNRDFQRLVTEYCWGEVWGEETLSPRERSILTLGMVAALGKMGEFANHVRGAGVNGLTPKELSAVLIQIAIYCGIPVGADCFQVAEGILSESHNRSETPLMSDHISGPRAIADPVTDITDVYAFPCPESPRHLVLVMNVFPVRRPLRGVFRCGDLPAAGAFGIHRAGRRRLQHRR